MTEKAALERTVHAWSGLASALEDVQVLIELAEEEEDEESLQEAVVSADGLDKATSDLEFQRMLSEDGDDASAMMEINSGAGGKDAADWAYMLQRMYLRWADRNGHKVSIVDVQQAEEGGITRSTLSIEGPFVYGYLKSEIGVHRLVRLSPFDTDHGRHTSFALIEVLPEVDNDIEVNISPDDLKYDIFKASGPGGQNVQKNSTAVRLTHIPTGIVVTCQDERSQYRNKDIALKILRAQLVERELEKKAQEQAKLKGKHITAGWGNQIRSYVLHPYKMVKDHRTTYETANPDAVLDGDIDGFLMAYLKSDKNE